MAKKKSSKDKDKKRKKLLCDIPFLLELVLGIGEVSALTGVPQRQLRYWQEKGLIEVLNERANTTRKFDYFSVKKIKHIWAYLELGYSLDDSASKAETELKPLRKSIDKYRKKLELEAEE